ncbi:MAG: hypothetical protein IT456_09010 [Planctomycetes bacterium]|nr:hypothetical protein [Planctomycetota bacterium]
MRTMTCGFLVAFALPVSVMAQTTITVPNGADLAPYIAAAAPGDTLLLGARHPNFTLNKGLHLVGNGTVIEPQQASQLSTVQIPGGQRACLSNLQFPIWANLGSSYLWGSEMLIHGDVRLEGCSFSTMYGAMTVSGGNVLLRNCQLYADFGGDPLLVTGGVCSVIGTTATGNDGLQVYMLGSHDASPGIRQTGGTLWIAHSTLLGGDVGDLYGQPVLSGKPALLVSGGTAFVVDSTLTGGAGTQYMGFPVPAKSAIQALGGQVGYARCNLFGGAGSPPAPPTTGNATSVPNLLAIQATGTMNQGSTFQIQATAGASGQILAIAASLETSVSTNPLAAQPVLGGGTNLIVQTVAAAPANGSIVTSSLSVPAIPALRGIFVTWQAFQWDSPLVQASPLVGSVVH